MAECEFCKIANNKGIAYIVMRSDYFLAFLDIHPLAEGHTLVIPLRHYDTIWQMPVNGLDGVKEYMAFTHRVAMLLKSKISTDQKKPVNMMTLGYEVPHASIHLIPNVYTGFGLQHANYIIEKRNKLPVIDTITGMNILRRLRA